MSYLDLDISDVLLRKAAEQAMSENLREYISNGSSAYFKEFVCDMCRILNLEEIPNSRYSKWDSKLAEALEIGPGTKDYRMIQELRYWGREITAEAMVSREIERRRLEEMKENVLSSDASKKAYESFE